MRISRLNVYNFRGIKSSSLLLDGHTVFVGDNNTGKSTILEAIDLVLGPERLSRFPIIDEHDFFAGEYLGDPKPEIAVEVVVTGLSIEQEIHFRNNLEFWDEETKTLLSTPPPSGTDRKTVTSALRVKFIGHYDEGEDDFAGETFFMSPINEDSSLSRFGKADKRRCGFLFLRTIRTGSRAMSLEPGSLLDVILRLQEVRPQMWEELLEQLRNLSVAENPSLEITPILENIQNRVREYVPIEWASSPHMKVSDLTRSHLRKILTFFISTGAKKNDGSKYSAPFNHQGTGTINTLVLSLLSMIADLKQNVIFAMEEPEIAIPPYTQKRIVKELTSKASQAIFTSHSPYVLEEFHPQNVIVVHRSGGELIGNRAEMPPAIKPKQYKEEFKRRFCEALLARRVLITEGTTEFTSIPEAFRRLNKLDQKKYLPLEALGIAIVNAETDSQVKPLGEFFKKLGKEVFAIFDKQEDSVSRSMHAVIEHCFESSEKTFEDVILNQTSESALKRFALNLVDQGKWPPHLVEKKPKNSQDLQTLKKYLFEYFKWSKGHGTAADLFSECNEREMPKYVTDIAEKVKKIVESKHVEDEGQNDFQTGLF